MPEPSDERGSLFVARGVEREDDELVSSDSSDGVTRSHDRLEPLGQRAENGVPRAVPPDVVHVLEAVEVHDDEGERLFAALVVAECLLDAILEQHAVRKAGQRVPERVRSCGCELPVQCDAACAGEHSDQHQRADHTSRLRVQRHGSCSSDEHEGGQRQGPCNRSAQMPPVSDLHLVLIVDSPLKGAAVVSPTVLVSVRRIAPSSSDGHP